MGTFDVLGSDPYPIGEGNKTTSGVHQEVNMTVWQTDDKRPVWEVIQAMNWKNYHKDACPRCHTPTYTETRSMTWQSIAGERPTTHNVTATCSRGHPRSTGPPAHLSYSRSRCWWKQVVGLDRIPLLLPFPRFAQPGRTALYSTNMGTCCVTKTFLSIHRSQI